MVEALKKEIDFAAIEKKWQRKWEETKCFEANPDKREKYFINFPYPYINAYLHLGHAFSATRVDVSARYKRMMGFNVLFPQGWHCTGTPVWAAAQRVKESESKQLAILKSMGFSGSEIKKFSEPKHWIEVFVPAAKEDFTRMGASVDWRRSFITTDLNPRYDKFIQWQFRKLLEKKYIEKGKHPVVWCSKDKMPVGDHDRVEGEGETPQEYYLLKFKFGEGYLVAATLRPETVYGQTNMWVNPNVKYLKANVNGEVWIMSKPCAEKLAIQDRKIEPIEEVNGGDLIGKYAKAPGINREIIILPATFVDENMGTGIVTSVPSDAPYDYIALRELQDSKEFEKRYGFKFKQIEEIEDIEVIPIIKTAKYGDKAAVKVVEDSKIFRQDDERLEELTQEVYKEGYHTGVMLDICGPYAGMKVIEAKEKIKNDLEKKKLLEIFYELSGKVVCRCLTPCVVKVVSDQWFLKYSDKKWKALVREELAGMKLHPELVRQQFDYVIGWLNDWACTHLHGTGTRLPWDNKWIIESLSDSTIYMAYYTITHLLEKIPAEEINDELFDYVFLGKGKGNKKFDALKKEFEYWYPFDVRGSGKDLVQNHLSFLMFNHAAIFPKKYWPKAFSVNGWLLVGGEKMSKSKGNFFTIRDILHKYPADVLRASLMLGGEGLDDPNLDFNNAEVMDQKLRQFYDFVKEHHKPAKKQALSNSDKLFLSYVNRYLREGSKAMEEMYFRTAFDRMFFQLQRVLREYLKRGEPNQEVMNDFISVQIRVLQPFCPHIAEELWEKIGGKGFVSLAPWPEADESKIDEKLEQAEKNAEKTVEDILNILKIIKEKNGKEGEKVYVYVLPMELESYNAGVLTKRIGKKVEVFAVNDKKKYDPQGKASKAKPGKPGIYIE
jgi:leucyl-tRNA synthetase